LLNPIEKRWRWLRQAVLRNHPVAHDGSALQARVRDFLGQFAAGHQGAIHRTPPPSVADCQIKI
jgi:hypothetical protein